MEGEEVKIIMKILKMLLLTTLVVLCVSSMASAAAVGDSWVYCMRAAGVTGATAADMNSWFTFTGAVGNSSAAVTAPGVPANEYGLYISSNVPVVGIRTGTFSVNLPANGTYEVFAAWGATTSAKTNAKHVVTYAGGATNTVLFDQLAAANKNVWKSLGTYAFLTGAGNNAKVMLTNDNQTTSGSLYLGAVKFTLKTIDPVPEPSGLIALGTGLLGMVGLMRKRRA